MTLVGYIFEAAVMVFLGWAFWDTVMHWGGHDADEEDQ